MDQDPQLPLRREDALAAERRARQAQQDALRLPPGAYDANWFSLFNAVSWQITLGSPLILYAKSLGASATMLGVLAALTPLLVILQIPAAHLLPRYGYRKFVLAGWGSRTLCIFGLAAVPLLTFIEDASRLALVLLLLFIFNLLRGMASGAWLPWISQIIPHAVRGKFLSRDQLFAQAGCLVSLGMAAFTLGVEAKPWQFSIVFLFSALGASMSLLFLRRMPDVTAPEELRKSGAPVPWLEMMRYRPFFRLTLFALMYMLAIGGVGVFAVAFMREWAHFGERSIVSLSVLSVLGAITVLPVTGRIIDRLGSKPVIITCVSLFVLIIGGWFLLASHVIAAGLLPCGVLLLLGGIAGVNYQVAANRLAMVIVPKTGSNHFFAMYTVIINIAAGLSPIGWGLLLDGLGGWQHATGTFHWNRFSVFFSLALLVMVCAAVFALRLLEQRPIGRAPDAPVEPQSDGSSPVTGGGAVPKALRD
jgi:MFS family permease